MNSISKATIILRWKSNTQVEILSRKLTQKWDVTEQRIAVKVVLAPKVNFWDVGFAVLTYIWSVWYEGYVIQVVRYFDWKRLPNTPILVLMERIVISCSRHRVHVWHCHLFKSIYIPYSPAGTLNKCSNFEESMKLCRNVECDHLNYFSYSAIRNLIRHAIYFKLKNVILKP